MDMSDRSRHRWSASRPPHRRVRRVAATVGAAGLVLAGLLAPGSAHGASAAQPYDFNGDGYADLAVGVPGESLGDIAGAGAVQIIYGGSGGLTARGDQFWTQDSTGVKGKAAPGDSFGQSLTSADFDRDGYADLAVGIPGTGYGSVAVLYGARGGLSARDQLLYPADLDVPDLWGGSLTTGDFDGDGRDDLAIGGDPASPSVHEVPGAITVLRGTSGGLTLNGAVRLTKESPGVAGTSAAGDAFGMHLAAGDVNGDGRDDLAAATRQSIGTGDGVYFLPGSPTGITGVGSQFFDASTPGLSPPGTGFSDLGDALALADFNSDNHADLVVSDTSGSPPGSSDCAAHARCPGTVLVLRGTATGFSFTTGKQLWYQGAPGLSNTGLTARAFGSAVATGDLNGDGHQDLAIGVPGASPSGRLEAGAVDVLYGSAAGLASRGAQIWTQNSPGIKGVAEEGDYFGRHLFIADFGDGRSDDLAAAASNATRSRDGQSAGAVSVLYGSRRGVTTADDYWTQNTAGIGGSMEFFDQFGTLGS
jgi:hypothetical protein